MEAPVERGLHVTVALPNPASAPDPTLPPSPVARRIHAAIQAHPGIHFRGLQRAAQVTSAGQLRHHLDRLRRLNIATELSDGGFTRYFLRDAHEAGDRAARLSRPLARHLARALLTGPATRTQLRRDAGCADSTLGYQLRRLLAAGDLVRREDGRYDLADAEAVRRVLRPSATTRPPRPAHGTALTPSAAVQWAVPGPAEPACATPGCQGHGLGQGCAPSGTAASAKSVADHATVAGSACLPPPNS
jgi:hypothetical protein